jgi:hypothetical protein
MSGRRGMADLKRRGAGQGKIDLKPTDATSTEESLRRGGRGSTCGGAVRGREGSVPVAAWCRAGKRRGHAA